MKKSLCIVAAFFITCAAFAQSDCDYKHALGLKFPGGLSVTYKIFVSQTNNIEAQAMFWNKGFRAVGLYEFNFAINGADGLHWFVGPGAHIGFWKTQYQKDYNSSADFGVDGIIGLDYKFKDLPINASLDWEPSIVFAGSNGFTPAYGGLGIRYTF